MKTIAELKKRLTELHEVAKAIQARADAEKRDLNADEVKEIEAVMNEFDQVGFDIARRERIEAQASALAAPGTRRTAADPVPGQDPTDPAAAAAVVVASTTAVSAAAAAARQAMQRPRGGDGLRNTLLGTHAERARAGFRNFGEFAISVKNSVVAPGNTDGRLIAIQNAALSTYGSEGVGADGGFAVPPEWRAQIMDLVMAEDGLLGRTDQQTITGNNITFPTDETTAWQTTGGIQAYWDAEAATISQSKPQIKDLNVKLVRLTALVPVTEELLEDAPAMSGYVVGKAGEKISFRLNDAIINGLGNGMPLGIMKSPCLVTVAAEGSQVAATIHALNVTKMMARMPASSFARAAWLINQDCWPQIVALGNVVTKPDGTAVGGAGALYMGPNNTMQGSPFGTLLGRPIVVTEACAALGTTGDIILADLSRYLTVIKGAIRSDVSIHLWFDQNTTAFRFVLRMNGQPWLSAPIARKSGSNTLSHFVALAAR